jgi:hypothetical protein
VSLARQRLTVAINPTFYCAGTIPELVGLELLSVSLIQTIHGPGGVGCLAHNYARIHDAVCELPRILLLGIPLNRGNGAAHSVTNNGLKITSVGLTSSRVCATNYVLEQPEGRLAA